MGRSSFAILLVAAALLVFIALPKSGDGKASKRVLYWEEKLETDVPLNSSKDRLLEWAKENSIEFNSADSEHLSAQVEWISGFGSPMIFCSEWKIIIDVTLTPFDEVQDRIVRKVNQCT